MQAQNSNTVSIVNLSQTELASLLRLVMAEISRLNATLQNLSGENSIARTIARGQLREVKHLERLLVEAANNSTIEEAFEDE